MAEWVFRTWRCAAAATGAVTLAWSPNESVGFQRLVLTFIVVWATMQTWSKMPLRAATTVTQLILAAAVTASLATVMLLPAYAIYEYGNPKFYPPWMGVLGHKNVAGAVAALTVLFCIFGTSHLSRTPRLVIAALSLILLIGTASRTSIIGCAMSCIVIGAWSAANRNHPRASVTRKQSILTIPIAIALVIALIPAAIILAAPEWVLGLIQDPNIISNRGRIWYPLTLMLVENPILGGGYGGIWGSLTDTSTYRDSNILNQVNHAHNGYLDLALNAGLVGLYLAVFAFFFYPFILSRSGTSLTAGNRFTLPASIILFGAIDNLTELGFFDRDSATNVFMAAGVAMLLRAAVASSTSRPRSRRPARERDGAATATGARAGSDRRSRMP